MADYGEMFYGTLPQDTQDMDAVLRGVGRSVRDIGRSTQYLPYDVLGAPVDIATMAMRPFGYEVEQPVGGSDWLIEMSRRMGIADRPTGSGLETATRFATSIPSPVAVPRALAGIGRFVDMLGDTPPTGAISPEIAARFLPETKVVDEAGKPKLLYHGTNKEFEQFDESMLGTKTGNPTSKMGYFFSDSPSEASRYAADWGKEGGNVRPVYLDIKNPKRLTYKQMNDISMALFDESSPLPVNAWKTKEGQAAIEASAIAGSKRANKMAMDLRQQLIDEGYDGAVVRIGGKDEYIAFNPNQIKSAISDPQMAGLLDQPAQSVVETSYRGSHSAPNAETYGATLDSLEGIMPADVYSSRGKRLYGLGNPDVDAEWFAAAFKAKGKPDAEVTVYRAVPKGVKEINSGDWVTTSKTYADMHGENTVGDEYEILSKKVKAKTLSSEGYPYEFGYNE